MNEASALLDELSEGALWRLEEACCRFEEAWKAGQRPRLEDFVAGPVRAERLALLRELLRLEVYYRRQAGEGPSAADYETRFPGATALLSDLFAAPPDADRPVSPQPEAEDPEGTGPELQPPTTGQEHPRRNGDGQAPADPGDPPPSRYRKLRFVDAGSLGEVSLAEDTELHREVALKEIKQKHAQRPEFRGRFVLEAEVTGRLEHPGIVPVYGLGTYADGRPYYAMRFIKGDNLAKAITQFHAQTPVRFDSLAFRGLLGRFVAVCQAVGYAHSRGVLHRDLKPANILLGPFGETLVVDWGLAKVADRPGAEGTAADAEELLRLRGEGWAETASGALVGTPAFMSPEQARGEELGPATDVYSLGATLYSLLTNQLPFRGKVAEVLPQVQRGAWRPARQVNPAVPPALEAVCARAMALRPEDRYASAVELAGEVEHWLADEPVAAYPEPAGARLRRWMRKHPRRVTAVGVLLLAAVVGLTAGAVLLERSRREAEENFQITRKAARKLLVAVNDDYSLNDPAMLGVRGQLLVEALDYYKDFLNSRPGDPAVRQDRAEAWRQLGEVYRQMGLLDQAKPLVRESLREFNDLRETAPEEPELARGLARSHLAQADLDMQSGEPGKGRYHASQAIQLIEHLRTESPRDRLLLTLLGRGYYARATAEAHLGRLEAAISDNAQAVEFLDDAVYTINEDPFPGKSKGPINFLEPHDRPGRFENNLLLARAWINEGILLNRVGRKAAAPPSLLFATGILRGMQEGHLHLGLLRYELVLALRNSGHVEVELGRPARGGPALWEALEWARKLIKDNLHVSEYWAGYVETVGFLGEDLFLSGQTGPAAEWLREAVTVADELLKGNRKTPSRLTPPEMKIHDGAHELLKGKGTDRALRTDRARFLSVLGCLEGELGHLDSGLRYCEEAQEEQKRVLEQTPGDRSLRSDWLGTREAIARLRFLTGKSDADAWIREQREILREREELAGRSPVLPHFKREVGASAALLAELLLEEGKAQEALAVVEKVLPAHEQLVQADRPGNRLQAKGKAREEEKRIHALVRLSPSPTEFPKGPEPEDYQLRRVWAELLDRKSAALARAGQGAAAVKCVCQAIGIVEELARGDGYFMCPPCSWPSLWSVIAEQLHRQEPCYLYDLACHLALAAKLSGNEGDRDAATRAVAALRAYSAAGFDNVHKLKTDPRLDPLRGLPAFQTLVRELKDKLPVRRGIPSPRTGPEAVPAFQPPGRQGTNMH
jgi:tetratricopeptide (TPR) repeat protein/tRNA A-37 threonylcarbamoyl transferase component Bud32